jgi:AAA+ ATPase superfamily predicted ATPase
MSFIDPEAEVPADFTFASWELAFRQLALHAQSRRVAVFIDEVTYLIDVDPDFVGILQKAWDRWLSNTNLVLALAGSQMGLMRKHLLDYEAPLHGRATAQMQLPPLPYGTTKEYFPKYGAAERVTLYAMWGGVPAYWERMDPNLPIMENLRRNILPAHAWTIDESRILLQDFITDLHNYVGIMRAIADGQQAISEISDRTGLTSSKASFYLSVLRDTGFVVRQVPVTQLGTDSRRGRYFVTDPYLRFFYRFMSAYQSKLALGQTQQLLEIIQNELPSFIDRNTWQELCREWLLLASAHKQIPVPVDEVGSEWAKNYTVGVAGISDQNRSLVLGDTYWQEGPQDLAVVEELVKKTSQIVPTGSEGWSVHFVVFSASGWTEKTLAEANRLVRRIGQRKRWRAAGIQLMDLQKVDADLIRWSI